MKSKIFILMMVLCCSAFAKSPLTKKGGWESIVKGLQVHAQKDPLGSKPLIQQADKKIHEQVSAATTDSDLTDVQKSLDQLKQDHQQFLSKHPEAQEALDKAYKEIEAMLEDKPQPDAAKPDEKPAQDTQGKIPPPPPLPPQKPDTTGKIPPPPPLPPQKDKPTDTGTARPKTLEEQVREGIKLKPVQPDTDKKPSDRGSLLEDIRKRPELKPVEERQLKDAPEKKETLLDQIRRGKELKSADERKLDDPKAPRELSPREKMLEEIRKRGSADSG